MFFLKAHYHVERVTELTPERLRRLGIDSLLLDVDSTLKGYHGEEPESDIAVWLDLMRESGIGLCLASNGSGRRIEQFAAAVDLPYSAMSLKPLPFRLLKTVEKHGFDRKRTAMVGDQIFADVPAGRFARLTTIHVTAIRPEEEPLWTRFKRWPEMLVLKLLRAKNLVDLDA